MPPFLFFCCFFFRCRKLGCRSWAIPLYRKPIAIWAHVNTTLNSISSRICRQNTRFNMYTTTSKQQEGCTFKDSHPKCFITTDFDKFHREAFARGGESRWCFDSMFPWYTKSKTQRSIRMAFVIIMILFDVKDYRLLYGKISFSSEKIYTWQSRFLQMFINWCFWFESSYGYV